MPEHISTDDAEDIIYGKHRVMQAVSSHRWYDRLLVVFERDGHQMGFYYLKPKTELQEGQDIFEGDPVPVFSVSSREVITTVYEAEDASH